MFYDETAKGYDELHRAEQEVKIAVMIDWLRHRVQADSLLLDVGCGTGFSLDIFAKELGIIPIGSEPSKEMIKQYKGTFNLVCAPAEELPFEDNYFDVVTSVTAIQNFDEIDQGVSEICRVAKQHAPIIISCLKKSEKLKAVSASLAEHFQVDKILEEEKDIMFFCTKK